MNIEQRLDVIHDERAVAVAGLPHRTYVQSVTKHRREYLANRYPALARLWAIEAEYRKLANARNELIASGDIPLRIMADYGAPDGEPLPESKNQLHRIQREARRCRDCGEVRCTCLKF